MCFFRRVSDLGSASSDLQLDPASISAISDGRSRAVQGYRPSDGARPSDHDRCAVPGPKREQPQPPVAARSDLGTALSHRRHWRGRGRERYSARPPSKCHCIGLAAGFGRFRFPRRRSDGRRCIWNRPGSVGGRQRSGLRYPRNSPPLRRMPRAGAAKPSGAP